MSNPLRLSRDRDLDSQTIGSCQRSRSSRHRDSDVFARSRLDLRPVQAPKITKIVGTRRVRGNVRKRRLARPQAGAGPG